MTIRIAQDRITRSELERLAKETYVEMIKAVVDVRQGTLAIGGELHTDVETMLLENGSAKKDLWGINIYFRDSLAESLEYSSLINVRPQDNNRSLLVKDEAVRQKILSLVEKFVDWGA